MKEKKDIIVFLWKDAMMETHEQKERSEWKKSKLIEGITVGHVIHEDKEKITLGMDMFFVQDGMTEDNFRNVSVYPKNGIKKIIKRFQITP